jgi:(5-formylfuran-3-yl)methyl phosphate synthase
MHLLVSVTSAVDAAAALAGGADLVDAKDPAAGALGAVSIEQFRRVVAAVAGARPVTAALGDAADEPAIEQTTRAFAGLAASFVKIGFAGIDSADRIASLIAAAVRGVKIGDAPVFRKVAQGFSPAFAFAGLKSCATSTHLVAVAYADADRAGSISPLRLVDVAARAGATGVLLDTFDKQRGGLRELVAWRALADWVASAHDTGLFVAIAGKLTASDLPYVRDAGADIAGVRGAACEGGRTGCVTADRVRALRHACDGIAVVDIGAV